MDGREEVYGHETFKQGFDNVTQKIGLVMRIMENARGWGSSVGLLKPIPASLGIWGKGSITEDRFTNSKSLQNHKIWIAKNFRVRKNLLILISYILELLLGLQILF